MDMETRNPLVLAAETYQNEYYVLGDCFFFFHRSQKVIEPKEEIDVFGPSWALAVADLQPGQVQIRCGDRWIDVVGPSLIWIPNRATRHWRLGTGDLNWYSYLSTLEQPHEMPLDPCLIHNSRFEWPKNVADIVKIFREADQTVHLAPAIRNPWALKLKKLIDQEFTLNTAFEAYAQKLGVSHETLTRAFQKEFGLPPVQYRNKMRLLQASFELLMTGRRIGEISQALGFQDQSHFYHLFRREIRTTPKKFRF
ncbi:MAG: helix-turn-helix transcriptional regulator [Bdellovibrionales bacterium]|nr:helix-turn-helix transcriptional regulator [Bdellovibrionales bacterium]